MKAPTYALATALLLGSTNMAYAQQAAATLSDTARQGTHATSPELEEAIRQEELIQSLNGPRRQQTDTTKYHTPFVDVISSLTAEYGNAVLANEGSATMIKWLVLPIKGNVPRAIHTLRQTRYPLMHDGRFETDDAVAIELVLQSASLESYVQVDSALRAYMGFKGATQTPHVELIARIASAGNNPVQTIKALGAGGMKFPDGNYTESETFWKLLNVWGLVKDSK